MEGARLDALADLAAGALVHVGSCLCEITKPLGMGSFGVVWAGESAGVGEIAVKEILCRNEVELSRASYEADLLKSLTSASRFARLPAYVASETARLDAETYRMRLVMSRIPGMPLDRFLQERKAKLQAVAAYDPSSASSSAQQVAEAFSSACALTSQLMPIMASIAAVAYHRDVNAHNILISMDQAAKPQFGLVDFGLAVDAARWMDPSPGNPGGRSDWEFQDVGGDCRYWPTSAWRQFEVGCYELVESAELCLEYQTHLDLQGLGITAMQVLAEMLPVGLSHPVSPSCTPALAEADRDIWHVLQGLQETWNDYWEHATRFWAYLLQTFRNGGDWNALKNEFIALRVHELISMRLQRLRASLSDLERACRVAAPSQWIDDALALAPALQVMISAGERRARQTTWADVRGHLRVDALTSTPRADAQSHSARLPPAAVGGAAVEAGTLPMRTMACTANAAADLTRSSSRSAPRREDGGYTAAAPIAAAAYLSPQPPPPTKPHASSPTPRSPGQCTTSPPRGVQLLSPARSLESLASWAGPTMASEAPVLPVLPTLSEAAPGAEDDEGDQEEVHVPGSGRPCSPPRLARCLDLPPTGSSMGPGAGSTADEVPRAAGTDLASAKAEMRRPSPEFLLRLGSLVDKVTHLRTDMERLARTDASRAAAEFEIRKPMAGSSEFPAAGENLRLR